MKAKLIAVDGSVPRNQARLATLASVALTTTAILIGATTSTLAIDQKNPTPVVRPTKIEPSKLTQAECEGLGGTAIRQINGNACASGIVCSTTDKDGVIHRACITKQ